MDNTTEKQTTTTTKTTTTTTKTTTTTTTDKPCNWFHNGNGFCEDENNHASCNYDGGMLVYHFYCEAHGPHIRPMKPFFIGNQNFWAWADKLGR